MTEKLNVAVADDHTLVASGIRMLLDENQAFNMLPECFSGLQVLDLLAKGIRIDLLITDINMPDLDGISLVKEVRKLSPGTKIVFLTYQNDLNFMAQAFREGANAYVVKNAEIDELHRALDQVMGNKIFISNELTQKLVENFLQQTKRVSSVQNIDFTDREHEILHCIGDGMTNFEISEKLFLSKRTVEGHRQSLLEKTNSRNTATLIRYAVRNGLLD